MPTSNALFTTLLTIGTDAGVIVATVFLLWGACLYASARRLTRQELEWLIEVVRTAGELSAPCDTEAPARQESSDGSD